MDTAIKWFWIVFWRNLGPTHAGSENRLVYMHSAPLCHSKKKKKLFKTFAYNFDGNTFQRSRFKYKFKCYDILNYIWKVRKIQVSMCVGRLLRGFYSGPSQTSIIKETACLLTNHPVKWDCHPCKMTMTVCYGNITQAVWSVQDRRR